ncbi:hypothetical protein DL98DRAFT_69023 [Cadophora sp. DSE1049]|nr:hypothetical protein DL98DRAFT_69023 [Cadophora sp. DSE1049]
MTLKCNTQRAFTFRHLRWRRVGYNSIPITLLGTALHLLFLQDWHSMQAPRLGSHLNAFSMDDASLSCLRLYNFITAPNQYLSPTSLNLSAGSESRECDRGERLWKHSTSRRKGTAIERLRQHSVEI